MIEYFLTWPKEKMPENITWYITIFQPTMSIYWAAYKFILEYQLHSTSIYYKLKKFMKQYGIKLTRIDRFIIIQIQHSLLAIAVHLIVFIIFYLWYSPNMTDIDKKQHFKQKMYCILSHLLIPFNLFIDLKFDIYGDYSSTVHILSSMICSYFASQILETYLNCPRNADGIIPKITTKFNEIIINKCLISTIDKLHSSLQHDTSKLFIAIPFQAGVMTKSTWIILKINKYIYSTLSWLIQLFQLHFASPAFWGIYHFCAYIVGCKVCQIGLWIAALIQANFPDLAVYVWSILHTACNVNNMLLYV